MAAAHERAGSAPEPELTDELYDVDAVEAGAWVPGPYGPDDERGSFNEVSPDKTRRALGLLDLTRPVRTYSLGEELFDGYPTWGDRSYEQRLVVMGYQPGPGFEGEVADPLPQGPGRNAVHEERISTTYSLGTKVNGLHHVGLGGRFYNGFRGVDIARTWGTTRLGNETMGPIVTRGVLVDVLGLKCATGDDVRTSKSGAPYLRNNYRVTVDDIEASLERDGVDAIEPGDAVLIRTGWRVLIRDDPHDYLEGGPPGPYLRECRWLARHRPALVGSDTWVFEVIDPELSRGYLVPCHVELFMRFGIRIAESVRTDDLAADGVHEFVFCFNPQPALGATAANAPPLALGQP